MQLSFIGPSPTELPWSISDAASIIERLEEQTNLNGYWLAQEWGPDAMVLSAAIASRTKRVTIGTSIVPIWTRHPFVMAREALAIQEFSGGRFILGLGVSHARLMNPLGIEYANPVDAMSEYIRAVDDLIRQRPANVRTRGSTRAGESYAYPELSLPVYIAALGPQMLKVAGEQADGVITFLANPRYIKEVVGPITIRAAESKGRPAPTIVAVVEVALTTTPSRVRALAGRRLAVYKSTPAYRNLLQRSGVADPSDLLIAGVRDYVIERLDDYFSAGATHVIIAPIASEVGSDPDTILNQAVSALTSAPDTK